MASLRTLLDTVTTSSLSAGSAADSTTKLPATPAKGYKVQYITAQCGATCDAWDTNYNYYDYPSWQVPTGVTEVVFEIWGAGGGGGASCCCSKGIPGSSGAYAVKKITNAVAGCTYQIELGQGGIRTGNMCGDPGGKTLITGPGLTNFCASGGVGGCSCCFACCCTWFALKLTSCNGGCCALYYGADYGSYGVPGAGYMWCQDNHCWNKQFFAYPGGLVNGRGGWLPATQCENSGCGYCLMHNAVTQLPWGGGYSDKNYVPGVGGATALTCGGGCCYGIPGTPGMVRISYK